MSLFRRNPKRDQNEPEIVRALEKAGAMVLKLSGTGLPDLLVGYRRRWALIEVKVEGEQCTPAQYKTIAWAWSRRLPVAVVRDVAEAKEFLETLRDRT